MKFRKKPVVIEAVQVSKRMDITSPQWLAEAITRNDVILHGMGKFTRDMPWVEISTLEGTMRADAGDWIIRGVAGELYPCKPEIFTQTYEPADAVPTLPAPVSMPEPMTDDEIEGICWTEMDRRLLSFARAVEAEVLRRVKEVNNAAPTTPVQQDDEALKQAALALDEAAYCIADWGSYASDYFQEKHDLDGDIKRAQDAAAHFRALLTKRGAV